MRRLGLGLLLLALPLWLSAQPLFSTLFDQHGVVMLLIDPASGEIRDANPAAVAFYGHSRDELRRMTIQQFNTLSPEQVAAERRQAEIEGRNFFIFRHRLLPGDVRTVEVHSHPFRFGNETLLLSMIHDITPQRDVEEALWHYQQNLEEMVDSQVEQLRRQDWLIRLLLVTGLLMQAVVIAVLAWNIRQRRQSQRLLAQRTAEREAAHDELRRFAEIAAHHLMEPARRQISYVQRAQKAHASSNEEELRLSLGYIEEGARRLHVLIRDIQVYLAAATPRGIIQQQETATVVAEVWRELERRHAMQTASLRIGDLPKVWLDRPRLFDLFTRLLDNALVHRDPSRPLQVEVEGAIENGRCVLRVFDNGPGIDVAYQQRALGVFERLQVPRDGGGGSGVGLAIVRRIVNSCAGDVVLYRAVGGGTEVRINLPVGES